MNTFLDSIQKIFLNPVALSLLSGLIGAIIGGIATYLAANKAHKNNLELENRKLKISEKATALSIIEELKVIKEEYEEKYNQRYKDLNEKPLTDIDKITQDFSIIYTQNADKIGLIKDIELRNLIIKSYILLKKYIDDLQIYNGLYKEYCQNRQNFATKINPKILDKDCSKIIIDNFIDTIKSYPQTLLNNKYTTAEHVFIFIESDNNAINYLHLLLNKLKTDYDRLKQIINETISKAEELYKE